SLDQINNNSYDGMQLSKVIGILSLEDNLDVLISYDGGIAIPQSEKFSKRVDGITLCLVPDFNGAIFSDQWKEALWDKFYTAAPQRHRQCVEQYKIVKRA